MLIFHFGKIVVTYNSTRIWIEEKKMGRLKYFIVLYYSVTCQSCFLLVISGNYIGDKV